jgi:uncharacterized coiled-coil DUF342 family protein
MEASEKTQLALEGGAPRGTVRALEDRLVIEHLTVTDERAAGLVRERTEAGQDPARTVTDAIEIGARVLDREDAAAEVDYVRAELEKQAAGLRERLAKGIEERDAQLAERIAASFDGAREGSVQRQIAELLRRALDEQRTSMVKLFSAEDGANPLTDFKGAVVRALGESDARQRAEGEANRRRIEELTRELVELKERDEADHRVAEEAERGTAKGRSFEERVDLALERIAAARGDASSHTGGAGAEGGGRKGDTLVELGAADGPAAGRIVFEAKDKKLSKNDAWRELNEAMAARAASFAVLVVAGEDRVPAGREVLTEYEGNKLIVAVDRDEPGGIALEVGYRLAAARVAMARDRDLTVDAAAVRDAAEEAVSCLRQAQAIRATLTGIKTSSDKARSSLDEMIEDVRERLARVDALVEAADTGDPG